MTPNDVSGAVISECGRYRYRLWRCWNLDLRRCCFIMLNPSTADANKDDPTIRKVAKFAKAWGYGGIEIVNLFAWRATDPDELIDATQIGPENDRHIRGVITGANVGRVVCAWGNRGKLLQRDVAVLRLVMDSGEWAEAINFNKDGSPCHPLYQRDDSEVKPWPEGAIFELLYT